MARTVIRRNRVTADGAVVPEGGGALLVDKPEGPTSHDVVNWARRSLGLRRIGHTGTLDPFASGLLVLLVGPVTRLAEYLFVLPKRYEARARLGIRTDTHDAEGKTVSVQNFGAELTQEQVETELATFAGCGQQVPPQFSAKKVGGERMYKKARRGDTVLLPCVDVDIFEIGLTDFSPPEIGFTMACSSGTYVRAVARDLGDKLGVGAHLTALRRTAVGGFSVDRAVPGEVLRERFPQDPTPWVEPAAVVGHLTTIRVEVDAALRLRQGRAIPWSGEADPEIGNPIAVLDETGLVGIAEIRNGHLAPKKILTTQEGR
jgi:tRNA pseudouridine55 synthase